MQIKQTDLIMSIYHTYPESGGPGPSADHGLIQYPSAAWAVMIFKSF